MPWQEIAGFFVILGATLGGALGAPLWFAVAGALQLSALSWWSQRWGPVVAEARTIDAQWRALAAQLWSHGSRSLALRCRVRGFLAAWVVAVHISHSLVFAGTAYLIGLVVRLAWRLH